MRLISHYVFLSVVTVLLSSVGAMAQGGSGSIAGKVTDSSQGILRGARVEIQPGGKVATSDANGDFSITGIPPGKYSVTISNPGFALYSTDVTVSAEKRTTIDASLQVGTHNEGVNVTGARGGGELEALTIERTADNIVQVLPADVITSLPNTNIADAVGRLPSVSLERDEGEGKHIQIRGTEPRLSNVTINGVNVPSPETNVRNIKLDAVPSNIVERIEVYKTLSPDQDGDGIGGNVNLVTKTALDRPTYALSGTSGYNPIQNGYWRGGFDGTFGQRFGVNKQLGFLFGGTWDRTNRGIDDLEPTQDIATDPTT